MTVVLLEVPSGYFSDIAGRKRTLIIATMAGSLAALLFLRGHDFLTLALGQVALAASIAFNSGTDTAFHYDSLSLLDRTGEFENREARVARDSLTAGAAAAFFGGVIALADLRLAYLLSLLGMLAALVLISLAVEPRISKTAVRTPSLPRQIRTCIRLLDQPRLAWLSAFLVFMVVINHIPYEFYQPYIRIQFAEASLLRSATPAVSGLITALTMLLAAWGAVWSTRLHERWGLFGVLLFSGGLQTFIIGSMAWISSPIILLLILLRSTPRGLMTAPLNAALAPLVPQSHRASFLSLLNLAGKLGFSLLLFSLSHAPWLHGADEPANLRRVLFSCLILAVSGLLALALTRRALDRSAHGPKGS